MNYLNNFQRNSKYINLENRIIEKINLNVSTSEKYHIFSEKLKIVIEKIDKNLIDTIPFRKALIDIARLSNIKNKDILFYNTFEKIIIDIYLKFIN